MPDDAPGGSCKIRDTGEPTPEKKPVRAILFESIRAAGSFLRRYWLWGAVVLAGIFLWYDMKPDVNVRDDGPTAPGFELEQMNGKTFSLAAHRGEVIVLNVWATWCQPCHQEIPGFIDLQETFAKEDVTFVGLSIDEGGFDAVRPFVRRYGVNYPQLASQTVAWEKYGATRTVPRTYVIDRQGQIRYQHTGLLLKGRLEEVLRELTGEAPNAF